MAERTRVLIYLVASLALYGVAFATLSYGGVHRSPLTVGVGAFLLAVAAIAFQLTLRYARERDLLEKTRLWIAVGAIVAGVLLVVAWLVFDPGGGVGLSGVCAIFLGFGQLLAEGRSGEAPRYGLAVCAACAAAFALGLALCIWVHAFWLGLSALALLAAPVGLTLLSEDVMSRRKLRSWLAAPAGLLVALGGVLLLIHRAGVPPQLAWPLAGALFGLVLAIASSTQADVLLVVTVVGLAWTTLPEGVPLSEPITAQDGRPALVSLGDSYMSGEGAGDYFEKTNQADENECRRAPTAYAHEVVAGGRAGPLERLAFFACSGAETPDLDPDAQYPNEPVDDGTPKRGDSQVTQLEARHGRGDAELVIVSIGGNDAGFGTIGMACLAPGSCVERGQLWLDRLDRVADRVEQAYRKIRRAVGDSVPVVAVPYPQPIRESSCPHSLLEDDEHRFLHGFVKQLNGRIRQAARDARIYFLDEMRGAFGEGLRICDGRTEDMGVNFIALKSVNGLVEQALLDPAKWIHNSLHPNETGHDEMGKVLERWLRAHPDPPVRPRPEDLPDAFTPAALEAVMGGAVPHCGGGSPEPDYCDRASIQWAITKVGQFVAGAALPALALVLGCWLFWLPVLARTRRWWAERAGGAGATS